MCSGKQNPIAAERKKGCYRNAMPSQQQYLRGDSSSSRKNDPVPILYYLKRIMVGCVGWKDWTNFIYDYRVTEILAGNGFA